MLVQRNTHVTTCGITVCALAYALLLQTRISGKIPGSWSALSVLRTVDLGDNMLNGVFPLSWRELRGKLEKLSVDQNPLLKVSP